MPGQVRLLSVVVSLIALLLLPGSLFSAGLSRAQGAQKPTQNFEGRWRVKLILSGVEKNLVLEAKAAGFGFLRLLDTGPDNKPVATPLPAAWSQLTNDRVSFSGEAEMPIGTCCREIGTLIFKGRFTSSNLIEGKLIFVTSVDEEESPNQFHTAAGTFTAVREP